ncbi:hypothetical protein AXF42_Ash017813 [Apostasia shenzhenica]|uniref:Uncharacterized protein n=1 Tax=Apostasia shenzhenica TaxID=1088818 RepID=A0A2I0A3V6_9ASPA|nr:hypothetical protein AXF42_Ash017813 [Apostasia shenzhenica]
MPTAAAGAECRGGPSVSLSMSFRSISVISLRRNQVASMEPSSEEELLQLDLLHCRLVTSLQSVLPLTISSGSTKKSCPAAAAGGGRPVVSLPFLYKLIDAFLDCESDFKSFLHLVLSRNPNLISRPPLDRAVSDLLDRSLKALDLCNSVSLSIDSLRNWNRHADIAASALIPLAPPAPSRLNRARSALSKLAGRSALSFTSSKISRSWSATKQLQAMATSTAAPRSCDSGSAAVLAIAVNTISTMLAFVMWVLVLAFPCGGGVAGSSPPPATAVRQIPWTVALAALQDRVVEERRRERGGGGTTFAAVAGILTETLAVERVGREVMEAVSNGGETIGKAAELAAVSRSLEDGLLPFEMKVRDLFHRVVRSREEVLRRLDIGSRSPPFSIASLFS